MEELKKELESLVQQVIPLVKQYWNKGQRSTSVCIECNIDKAKSALQSSDKKQVKLLIEILKSY